MIDNWGIEDEREPPSAWMREDVEEDRLERRFPLDLLLAMAAATAVCVLLGKVLLEALWVPRP
jgi:hypothetical protein